MSPPPDHRASPRLANRLLEAVCPPERYEEIRGDLEEVYQDRLVREGVAWAMLLHWIETVFFLRTRLLRRRAPYQSARGPIMWKNYLNVAQRHIRKHKGYAFLNVGGLAVGLACCLLIVFFVQDELSYDRHLPNAERIYRVTQTETSDDRSLHRAVTPPALAPTLKREFAEVQHAVRFGKTGRGHTFRINDRTFHDVPFSFADSVFFEVFRLPFLLGDPATAFREPNSVILSRTAAQRYFGDANPLGQRITPTERFERSDLVVTGVIEDIPSNTHFSFDLLVNRAGYIRRDSRVTDDQWWLYGEFTYVLLPQAGDRHTAALEQKLPILSEKYLSERSGVAFGFHLQPVTRIHLYSHLEAEYQPNSQAAYVYIFSGVALLILLIACINFMNLATARATQRAREVGVRKVVGAHRGQLIGQFLGESVMLAGAASALALVLAWAALPLFNHLAGKALTLHGAAWAWVWLLIPGMALLVGGPAGSYPAFFLSAFRPASVLKGGAGVGSFWAGRIRRGLVVAQFAFSIILLIGTAVVYTQWTYMQQADLGFEKEHVVVLPYRSIASSFTPETIRQELLRHPGVQRVSMARFVPTDEAFGNGSPIPEGLDYEVPAYWRAIDEEYIATLGLEVIAGRGFSDRLPADSVGDYGVFLVNETAARQFGWTEPLGKALLSPFSRAEIGRVIGVVKDFHVTSLHEEIKPLVYFPADGSGRSYRRLIVRLNPGQVQETMAFLEQQWSTFAPGRAFSYFFLDEQYDALYRFEQRLSQLIGLFALLAVLVACLGLFGLAAFTATQRTKESGIRKVLGATVPGIVVLLSKEFVKLVLWAVMLAAPVAYLAAQRWLEGFAYRVEISWGIFLMVGSLALAIALVAVGYQSIRAALADPVESLRHE